MSLSISEWGLLFSVVFNVVTVIGWVYNHNRKSDLQKEILELQRRHERSDRDLADFRERLIIIGNVSSTLSDQMNNYLKMSLLCQPDEFDIDEYEATYGQINATWTELRRLLNQPDYHAANNYLSDDLSTGISEWFERIKSSRMSFAESSEDPTVEENLHKMRDAAKQVAIECGALAGIIGMTYGWIDDELMAA